MCCTECTLSVRYSCCYNMNHWKRMTWHWVAKLRPAIFSRALLDPLRLNLARSSHYSIAWFSDASVRIPPKAVFFVPAAQLPPLPPCPQHFPWSTPTFRSCRPLAGLLPASCRPLADNTVRVTWPTPESIADNTTHHFFRHTVASPR